MSRLASASRSARKTIWSCAAASACITTASPIALPTFRYSLIPTTRSAQAQVGPSDFDRTHRFVFSGVYDLPKFYDGHSAFAKAVADNWETAGIVTLQTGLPYSVSLFGRLFAQ